MNDFKRIASSPLFILPTLIIPLSTYFVSLKFVPKKEEYLIYVYVTVAVLLLILLYYIFFNWEKAKKIKELEKELDNGKRLLDEANKEKLVSDAKLKKVLKFSRESVRNIRRSCDMMTLSIGNLNTNKNKNNQEDIKNIVERYEHIRIEADNLEGNLDE